MVAIDIDRPVLGRAKQRFPSAQVVWKHADILEDDLGSFDAVISNATLRRVRPPGSVARPNVRRVAVRSGSASRGPSAAR
ncbi:MAG TPA: class I SAM-dependent methyltransferase [Mycobacterium sp.]|nr:class I SAM-dependent methyltransferase [Mycobacterium sp.]